MILQRPRRTARAVSANSVCGILLYFALFQGACTREQPAPPPALPPLPARVDQATEAPRGAEQATRELRLALVGEVRGEIEPCGCPTLPFGGFARRERLLAELRAEPGGPVFHLDAGELLLKGQSTRAADPERVALVLELQREVGVDVWAPGPTDLRALGLAGLRAEAARPGGPRLIGATWTDAAGAPLLPPSAVVERDGVRLGVIGLGAAPTDSATRALVRARDPVEAATAALATLPSDLDLVVALGSVTDAEADRVAALVPGLAAVLTTRGSALDEPRVASLGATPVLEAPDRGRYVQVIQARLGSEAGLPLLLAPEARDWRDLEGLSRGSASQPDAVARKAELVERFQSLGRGRNLAVVHTVPLGSQLDGDAAVSRRLARWQEDALAEAARAAAAPTTPGERGYATSGACVNCHTSEFARWAFSDHARAWESLVMRRATNNPECVSCHSTGFGQPGGLGELTRANLSRFKGVQCESCHGPMAGHPEDESVTTRPVSAEGCVVCHDEANSPQFDFTTYLARATCQGGAPATDSPSAPGVPGSATPAGGGP